MRSWVEISRGQIAANYRSIREVVGESVEVMPVVKADAYNHGAVEVSRILAVEGVRRLAVASVEEGVALRQSGIETAILVMAGLLPGEWDALVEHRLTPVLHSLDHVRNLSAIAARAPRPLAYQLKIDTGLHRLGMQASCAEILAAVRAAQNIRLEGVMTHLASPEDFESSHATDQIRGFLAIRDQFGAAVANGLVIHVCSTNAIAYGRREAWQTLVRPGLSVYGYVTPASGDPPERLLNVKPALTWKAAVLAVKDVPEGAPIGYNGRFRTSRPTRTAVLAAGYADGYPHHLGNKSKVIVKGVLAPVLGAVSMDLLVVDITDCPPVAPGDAVTLLGCEGGVSVDAQDLARLAGTIPYVVLCGIGRRVERRYVD